MIYCQSELRNVELRCLQPATVSTYVDYLGAATLCLSCYTAYYNHGYITLPQRAVKPRPIHVDDLRIMLNNLPHYQRAWRDYYEVYQDKIGIPVSTIIRNLLIQHQNHPLTYYQICDIVAPIDEMISKADWLTTDNGTTFTRTFQPRPQ